jgi:DNA modification methylase
MLVCCDARVALRDMADQSVDLVVTDPPYRTISGGNTQGKHQRPSGMLTNNDGRIFRHNDITFDEWLPEAFRVLRDPGHCYVMTNLLNLWDLHRVAVSCGFKVHNLLVWKKKHTHAKPLVHEERGVHLVPAARQGTIHSASGQHDGP